MKTLFRLAAFALLVCLSTASASEELPGTEIMPWRDAVRRIELACEIALREAKSDEEKTEHLYLRNRELAALVDLTYQSLLAWMARRPDLTAVLENEQEIWQTTLAERPAATEDELRRQAELLHERLRIFGLVIAGGRENIPPGWR